MAQDFKKEELKRLRADLESATDGEARTELRREIAFAEAIVRMRDGLDCHENAPDPVGDVTQEELNSIWETLDLARIIHERSYLGLANVA